MISTLLIGLVGLLMVVGLAALLLYWRDRTAKAQGKTVAQVQARFSAILQFRATLELCIPGALTIVFGIFWVLEGAVNMNQIGGWVCRSFPPGGC